jgi:hypothetical protein
MARYKGDVPFMATATRLERDAKRELTNLNRRGLTDSALTRMARAALRRNDLDRVNKYLTLARARALLELMADYAGRAKRDPTAAPSAALAQFMAGDVKPFDAISLIEQAAEAHAHGDVAGKRRRLQQVALINRKRRLAEYIRARRRGENPPFPPGFRGGRTKGHIEFAAGGAS